MLQTVLSTVAGITGMMILSILTYVIRIFRQQARMIQYFVKDSPVSEDHGGTLPRRVIKLESRIGQNETDIVELQQDVSELRR